MRFRRRFHPLSLLVAILAMVMECGRAQNEVSNTFFQTWQTADGLPDNSVTGVVQSPDGYLWIGTEGGLSRFNGTSITNISLKGFPSVRNRAVRAMRFDRHGELWLGMERGPLIRLGRRGGRTFSEVDGLFPQGAVAISEDGEGAVWVAYPDGLCRIIDDEIVRFTEAAGLPAGPGTWVGKDFYGQLWFAKGGNVGVYRNGGFETLQRFAQERVCVGVGAKGGVWIGVGSSLMSFAEGGAPVVRARLPDRVEAHVLFEDPGGVLWIGTATDGLFRLIDGVLEKIPTSNQEIVCLSQDREGNLWAGTNGGGLNLIRSRALALIGRKAGLPFDSVFSVCEDSMGSIWAVGQNGGVARRHTEEWKLIEGVDGKATCVTGDTAGGVWVGTRDRGLGYLKNGVWRHWRQADGLASDNVRSILTAKSGDVWIAMDDPNCLQRLRDGGLTRFQAVGEIGAIPTMAEGPDGTIWIGTEEGWILRVSDDSLVIEPAISEPAPMPVRSLHFSSDGSLWIAYGGDGLGWFKDGHYARITTAEGLMDDYLSQLLSDGQETLWIASNLGIFQVDLAELLAVAEGRSKWVRSRVYGRGEGLPSMQPNREHSPSACRASNGHLWFSMRNGLVVAQPEKIRDNPNPPLVLLERVTLDDEPAALYGNRTTLQRDSKLKVLDLSVADAVLEVPPGNDKLKFEFAALSFASPENVHFRYRLKNFDRDWIEADTQHSATYPRLPAGNYQFQVIACNNAGVWNDTGVGLALTVAPFFWETWWFKIGGGLATVSVAGGAVFLGQRRRYQRKLRKIAAKREIEEERARIARDIHDDLGASLTRILLLSRPPVDGIDSQPVTTLAQIYETSRHLIRSMGEVVWAVNPEQDTFDGLADYLSNYAQSFLGLAGIRCRLEMPLKLPERSISAQIRHNLFLAFKEALNNVVKYSSASEVRISLLPSEMKLVLKIEDDGKGIGAEAGKGHGLSNMSKRLEKIGGSCEVASEGSGGTTIRFEVHLKKES